jgi:hypothetical protein
LPCKKRPVAVDVTLDPVDKTEGNGKTETLSLEAGTYFLTILISKGEMYAGINEAVHIKPLLKTEYTKDFTDADLLAAAPITNVEISVTAPTKGAEPNTTASGTGNFSIGMVSWSPADDPFLGNVAYTATVTLTANNRCTFTGLSSASVNSQSATISNNTGATVMLSHTFPVTDDRTATGITIKTPPTNLVYTHGDTLDLAGLAVTLAFDDDTTEDVEADGFDAKNITVNFTHGSSLSREIHHDKPVTITYGSLTSLTTDNLTVNQAAGDFGTPAAINTTYTPTLTLASLTLPTGYAWNAPSTSLNAGDGQDFDATYTDPSGNYTVATGNITVNVAKATGTFITLPEINKTYTPGLTLADLTLPTGYAWDDPSTSLIAGDGQDFDATYTNPNGNYTTASGSITVNVAQEAGTFPAHAAVSATYTTTLTLADLNSELEDDYAWANSSTLVGNAGNGKTFPATYTDPSGNYTTASGTITVNVAKATGATLSNAPTLNTKTHNSISINSVTASTGQDIEYAISETDSAPSSGWNTSTTFTDLTANTTYYIFARAVDNDNYETGAASGSLEVTTNKAGSGKFVYYWIDEDDDLVTDPSGTPTSPITVNAGETLTITAGGTGYSDWQWYLNGKLSQDGGDTYYFSMAPGNHIVDLLVKKDSKLYSATITIKVTDN